MFERLLLLSVSTVEAGYGCAGNARSIVQWCLFFLSSRGLAARGFQKGPLGDVDARTNKVQVHC